MHRKLWLSVLMLALGAALFVAASVAGAAHAKPQGKAAAAKTGGTMNVDLVNDVEYVDPSLSYYVPSWQIQYVSCALLVSYPDKPAPQGSVIRPEVATSLPRISNSGKRYSFTIRRGLRFSNGKPITADSFKWSIERLLNPEMQSPAAPIFAFDIVGAEARYSGKANSVAGVTASGNKLTINLTHSAGDFLARLALPFFCPLPRSVPIVASGVNSFPGSGPYYVASRTPTKQIVLKKNPFYKGKRPHNWNSFVYTVGINQDQSLLRVERGEADWTADGLNPPAYADLAKKYGQNRKNGQLQIYPEISILYLAMNTSYGSNKANPIFKNNVPLRKAVNFAIDRRLIVAQRGFGGGQPADQILAPGVAGYKNFNIYPNRPNLSKAKKLAAGHFKDKNVTFIFRNSSTGPPIAAVVQNNLSKLGLNITPQPLPRGIQIKREGTRGDPFDLTLEGWVADYPDPYDFLDVLLNGGNIKEANNNNVAYFNNPKYNKKMNAAARLPLGAKRYSTYRALDKDIATNAAPWASYANAKNRDFFSKRVGCYFFHPVFLYDLAASCRK